MLLDELTSDPGETQRIARRVISAMAYPGRLHACDEARAEAVLSAFAPVGTPVHVTAAAEAAGCAAPRGLRLAAPGAAAVVVMAGAEAGDLFVDLRRGSLQHPQEGALAVIMLDALAADASGNLTVFGPGPIGARRILAGGLSARWAARRAEVNAGFPMGVDALLIGPDGTMLGLPRHVKLEG